MRKPINTFILIGLLILLVGGCGVGGGRREGSEESITIAGSTSVQPFSEVLAEEFMARHPRAKINVQGGGSSQGIEAVRTGVSEIGASSRELTPKEKGLHEYLIARDGIVVVVHPSNPVNDLSLNQVKDIFSGRIDNWQEVGGQNREIVLVSREAGSGTRDGFETLAMDGETVSDRALIANSTGAIRMIVSGDRNAIGYISLAVLDPTVKPLHIDGIKPTAENILNGKYAISRPFIYLTREEPVGLAKAFIDFVLSDYGQRILEDEGLVKVKQ
ncbi:MAG: phosphate ABC transporter substrate-binding protein [Bacillota bacterium]